MALATLMCADCESTPCRCPAIHVLGHLSRSQREVAQRLAHPVSLDQVAGDLVLARSTIHGHWRSIRDRLALPGDGTGTSGASRVALIRLLAGMDPCPLGDR